MCFGVRVETDGELFVASLYTAAMVGEGCVQAAVALAIPDLAPGGIVFMMCGGLADPSWPYAFLSKTNVALWHILTLAYFDCGIFSSFRWGPHG